MITAHLNTMRKGTLPQDHPRKLVYLGGIYDLIQQQGSLSDHSFQFVAPILPNVRRQDKGYEIMVPTLSGDITHKDLLQALLSENTPAPYFAEIAKQLFDYDAVKSRPLSEQYAHYKAMADSTALVGYCYGSFAAEQVIHAFEKHMYEQGLTASQIASVTGGLKALHIAPITPVKGTSPATQMYFLQLSDTVAATYMDKDTIRQAMKTPDGAAYMVKKSDQAIGHFDPMSNANARFHEADKPLGAKKIKNALMVTSVTPAHAVGYYQLDAADTAASAPVRAQEKQYHPNFHGIRGYVLSNRRLPEHSAVAVAQNNFSVMLPPLMKALVMEPEKLANIDTAQENFFTAGKLEAASKSLHTAKRLSEHVSRNYNVEPFSRR